MKFKIYMIYIFLIFNLFKVGCSPPEGSKTPNTSRNKWKKAKNIYSNKTSKKSRFRALILGTNAYFKLNQPKYIYNQLVNWNTRFKFPHFNQWLQREVAGSKYKKSAESPVNLAASRKWSQFFHTEDGILFEKFYHGDKRSNRNNNKKIIELFKKYLRFEIPNPLPFFIYQKFHLTGRPLQLDKKDSKLLLKHTLNSLPLQFSLWLYSELNSNITHKHLFKDLKNRFGQQPAVFKLYLNQVKPNSFKNLLKSVLKYQYPLPALNNKNIIDYKLLKYIHYLGIVPVKMNHDNLKSQAEHLRLQGKIKKAIALLNKRKPNSTFSARLEAALLAIHFHDFKAADRHLRWARSDSNKITDIYTRLRMLTGELTGNAVFSEIKSLYEEKPKLISSILRNKLNFHLLQLLSTDKNKRELQEITSIFTRCLTNSSSFFKYWSAYTGLNYNICNKSNNKTDCPDFSNSGNCKLPPLPELEFTDKIAPNTLPFLLKKNLSKIYKTTGTPKISKNKSEVSDPDFSLLDLPNLLQNKFSRKKFVKILEKLESKYWKKELSEFVFNYFNYLHKNSNRGKLAAVEGAILADDQLRAEYYFDTTLYKSNKPDELLQQGVQVFLKYGLRRVAARLILKNMERQKTGFGIINRTDSKYLAKEEFAYLNFLYQAGFWKKLKKRISFLLKQISSDPWNLEIVKFKIADNFPLLSEWNNKLSQFSSLQYKTVITLNHGSIAQSQQILKLLDYIFPARFDIKALLCLIDSNFCRDAVKLYKLTSGAYEFSELSITKLLKGKWQTSKTKHKLLEFQLFLHALGQTYKINNQDLAILARTSPILKLN
ncbi:MAG: hypothetical protein ACQES9_00540 [Myxococcota bacterium]